MDKYQRIYDEKISSEIKILEECLALVESKILLFGHSQGIKYFSPECFNIFEFSEPVRWVEMVSTIELEPGEIIYLREVIISKLQTFKRIKNLNLVGWGKNQCQ